MNNLRLSAKIDAQGIIVEVNQDYLDLLGYSRDEMLNSLLKIFNRAHSPSKYEMIQ